MIRVLFACFAMTSAAGAETLYISNEESDVIHIVDAETLKETGRIAVGQRPRGLALSPDGRRLYVAVSNDNRIATVDRASGKVVGHLPSGPDPETLAVSPDGQRLYVANEDDNLVSFVDVAAGRIVSQTAVGGEPEGTAVSPDGKLIVQASESASMAHVIEAATAKVVDNLLVDTRPRFVAFTPDGKQFWVSSEVRATITIFDSATRKPLGKVQFPGSDVAAEAVQPVGIVFTRDGRRAFVALGRAKRVAEIDPKTFRQVRSWPVGWRAWNLALSADERRLYTANGLSGDISVVDLIADQPVTTVKLGGKPWGIVAAP